jgi:DNA-binding transcriptional ArsR family regulator
MMEIVMCNQLNVQRRSTPLIHPGGWIGGVFLLAGPLLGGPVFGRQLLGEPLLESQWLAQGAQGFTGNLLGKGSGGMRSFDEEWNLFLQKEMHHAQGKRLERLKSDLFGERKMFQEVLWPVFKSFDEFSLEYELKSLSGVTIFIDALYHPLRLAFESEGFVPHAEKITRDRFAFERMRIRTLALYGFKYIPFSSDELDKHADSCRQFVYSLLGKFRGVDDPVIEQLSVYEREIIRYANRLQQPFRLDDAVRCLGMSKDTARRVLRKLLEKKLVRPMGRGRKIIRQYALEEQAKDYLL